MAEKLTEAQRRALLAAQNRSDPSYGLKGRSERGGFARTVHSLLRRGLLDAHYQITDAGRRALASRGDA